jgi:hypothetical protein
MCATYKRHRRQQGARQEHIGAWTNQHRVYTNARRSMRELDVTAR